MCRKSIKFLGNYALFFATLALCFSTYFTILNYPYFLDDCNFLNHHDQFDCSTIVNTQVRQLTPFYLIINNFLFNHFQSQPWIMRLMNIFLFASNVFLLFIFVRVWIGNKKLALLTGILFAVHPIHYMSVNYISNNSILLYYSFLMISLICLSLSLNEVKRRGLFMFLSFAALVAGLMCFEGAFLFPFYVVICLVFFKDYRWKTAVKMAAPYAVIAGMYFIIWKNMIEANISFFTLSTSFEYTPANLIATYIALVKWYVANLLYPTSVVLIRNMSIIDSNALIPHFTWGVLFLIFYVCCIELIRNSKIHGAIVLFLIGFIAIFPAMFVYSYMGFAIAPHWLYFSSTGFFILMASIFNHKSLLKFPKLTCILLTILTLSYMVLTHTYNYSSRNEHALASQWLRLAPNNTMALMNLAKTYAQAGDFNASINAYNRVLQTSTYDPAGVHNRLANVYLNTKDFSSARKHIEQSLKLNPTNAFSYNTLGLLLIKENKLSDAKNAFKMAIHLDRNYANPRLNLAGVLMSEKNYSEVIDLYKEFLANFPNHEKHVVYAQIFDFCIENNNFLALQEFFSTFKGQDNSQEMLRGIIATLINSDKFDNARVLLGEFINLDPYNKENYLLYGKVLANHNYFKEAVNIWKQGMLLDTADKRFTENIASAEQLQFNQ